MQGRAGVLLLAFSAASCAREPPPDLLRETPPPPPREAPREPRLRFKDAGGRVLLEMKAKERGFKVYGETGGVLGEAVVESDRVKLKDPQQFERWKIKRKDSGAEVEDAAGQRLYRLKAKESGAMEFLDASGSTVVTTAPQAAGLDVLDPRGRVIATARPRGDRVVLKTPEGGRLGELEGTTDARAALWFGVQRLSRVESAALCVYFMKVQR